jgi:transporter family-2 protein
MQYGAMFWAVVVGAALVVQVGLNAALRAQFGSAAWAASVNFVIGTAGLLAFALVSRAPPPTLIQAATVPWWAWFGGLLGAAYVASSTVLGPRLGAATFTALVVGAQMIASLVVDHYGLVGFQEHAATLWRVVGAVLIVVGVVLVTRG